MEHPERGGNERLIVQSYRIGTPVRSVAARSTTSEAYLEMSEQTASSRDDFQTALGTQQQRVLAALTAEETIDATPVVREDETLSCEEYVTLVYELHHVHLPELQADEVIEFDRHEETVRRGPRFDKARSLVNHDADQ